MRIDWKGGQWNVYDIATGALLGRARCVVIRRPSELVNTDGDRHGWLVTDGTVRVEGDRIIIE